MSLRLTSLAFLTGASMLSAETVSERLNRLEAEVAQLRNLLQTIADGKNTSSSALRTQTGTTGGRTHCIRSGDSYWSIACRYSTTVSALKSANPGVDPRRLTIGKLISIPGGRSASQGISSSSGTYRVEKGDILGRISEAHGIRLDQLLSANPGLNPRVLKIGTVLKIPSQALKIPSVAKTGQKPVQPASVPPAPAEASKPAVRKNERSNPYLANIVEATNREVRRLEEADIEKPRLVVIDQDLRFSELAERFKTTVADLNKLNKRKLSPKQMIKSGSQLYIPSR